MQLRGVHEERLLLGSVTSGRERRMAPFAALGLFVAWVLVMAFGLWDLDGALHPSSHILRACLAMEMLFGCVYT